MRELDRRLEQLRPRQAAVGGVDRPEPRSRAGHGARGLADPEHLGRRAVAAKADIDRVHRGAFRRPPAESGRGDEEVGEPRRTPIGGHHEREAARTRPGQRALGNPAGKRRSHARIDRIAALFEDARPGRRSQRMSGGDRPFHALAARADDCAVCIDHAIFTVSQLTRAAVPRLHLVTPE